MSELELAVLVVVGLAAVVFVRVGLGPIVKVVAALGLFRLYRAAMRADERARRNRW